MNASVLKPENAAELCEMLREPGPFQIRGSGSKRAFLLPPTKVTQDLDLTGILGIVSHEADDLVVVVRAGTPLSDLQAELGKKGHCLPYPDPADFGLLAAGFPGTVGGLVAMALPHGLEAQCGGVRDWVLGLTIARPDGTLAKCGSKAVKNVAGYDVQRLMVGARGTLGVIVEAIFRVFPLRALPSPKLFSYREPKGGSLWIQRTLRTDFEGAVSEAGERLLLADPESCTLWAEIEPGDALPRCEHDWVLRSGGGADNLPTLGLVPAKLMKSARALFDPDAKLNPGAMGAA